MEVARCKVEDELVPHPPNKAALSELIIEKIMTPANIRVKTGVVCLWSLVRQLKYTGYLVVWKEKCE